MEEKPRKKGKGCLIAIVVVVVLLALIGMLGGSDDSDSGSSSSSEAEKKIEYTTVSIGDMEDELEDNALNAEDEYNDKYIEVEGKLDVIDSDGSYFTIVNPHDEWDITGITCYITDDSQLEVIKKHSTGDSITVKGQVTEVGEVIGYYVDVDEVE